MTLMNLIEKMIMPKLFKFIIPVILVACATPNNLVEQSVQAVYWQQYSDEKDWLCRQAFDLAYSKAIENTSKTEGDMPMAVIVDLDETILDNSTYEAFLIKSGIEHTHELWSQWIMTKSATPVAGSLEFCRKIADKQIEIFYISNRSQEFLEPTLENLESLGYPFADEDHLLLKVNTSDKSDRRETASAKRDVILIVGDQLNDFDNNLASKYGMTDLETRNKFYSSYKSKFVLIPNPMYGDFLKKINKETEGKEANEKAEARKANLKSAPLLIPAKK